MEPFSHHKGFLSVEQATDFFWKFSEIIWLPFAPAPNSRPVHSWKPDTDNPITNSIIEFVIDKLRREHNVLTCDSVFMNLYRDGEDYCPYHSDAYGLDTYTLSLGATRDFLLKPKASGTHSETFRLRNGDLYYMAKGLHETHKHSVPKRTALKEARISILFMVTHKPPPAPQPAPLPALAITRVKAKARIKPQAEAE